MILKLNLLLLFSIVLTLSWTHVLQAKGLGRSAYVTQIQQGSGQRLEAELVGDNGDFAVRESGVILADAHLELEGRPEGVGVGVGGRAKRAVMKKPQRVMPGGCLKGWVKRGENGQCRKGVAVSPHSGPAKDRTGK